MKNVLLLKGGGSTEHEIALLSANYIEEQIDKTQFNVLSVEIDKEFNWYYQDELCSLNFDKTLKTKKESIKIDMAIPCLHGFPGETGDIQSFLELIKLPYLGCNSETSVLCFNKLATKLWLEVSGIKTTPFLSLKDNSNEQMKLATNFLQTHKTVYVKATNQGSSVGCYRCEDNDSLKTAIKEAFNYSPFVILEKEIIGRELEVSVFEYQNKVIATLPGEIICPDQFYTYEEKYNSESKTETHVIAKNISDKTFSEIKRQALLAFEVLKLRHLSRVDFFLTEQDEVLINEINTFPGHTKISMFPMMMENHGVKYSDFLNDTLNSLS